MKYEETRRIYGSYAWKQLRKRVLARDGYVCQIRGARCTVVATEVDHIQPMTQGGAPLDERNCRAACKPCNSRRQWRRKGPVYLGPSRDW